MNRQSIKGYAIAAKVLDEALRGKVDGEKLACIFDDLCANPRVGLAKYMHLAAANHVLDDVDADLTEALSLVDPDEGGELTVEEQGYLILDWYKARDRAPEGVTVRHAAEALGVSQQRVLALINAGHLKAEKPKGRWVVDPESLASLVERRRGGLDITIDGDYLSKSERWMEGRTNELMGHGYSLNEAHALVYGPKTLRPSDGEGWELAGTATVADEHSDDPWDAQDVDEVWRLGISDGQARLYAIARALERADGIEDGYVVDEEQAAELLAVSMMMDDLEEEREAMELIAATTDPEELERLHEEWDERLEGFEDRWAAALDLR